MPLVIKMDGLDKDDFIIRCRKNNTNASEVVRELVAQWVLDHPDSPKIRQKPAVE